MVDKVLRNKLKKADAEMSYPQISFTEEDINGILVMNVVGVKPTSKRHINSINQRRSA